MNKWFYWNVFGEDKSRLEHIIQITAEKLEWQKGNNRVERFYFIRQYTQDAHVTFGIKLPEKRSSEVFEEIKASLQGALNRDFTEKEVLFKDNEEPYPSIQELKAIATECALLSKDGISLIACFAAFSHYFINASRTSDAIKEAQKLDNEIKKLNELKDKNEALFKNIAGYYLDEMKEFNAIFKEIIKNTNGLERGDN